MKPILRAASLAFSVVFAAVACSELNGNEAKVKAGTLSIAPSIPIGKAFESSDLCSTQREWGSFETEKGEQIVEFKCLVTAPALKPDIESIALDECDGFLHKHPTCVDDLVRIGQQIIDSGATLTVQFALNLQNDQLFSVSYAGVTDPKGNECLSLATLPAEGLVPSILGIQTPFYRYTQVTLARACIERVKNQLVLRWP